MTIDNLHTMGDTVFLKTDPDESPRLVTGIVVRPSTLLYTLACGDKESSHYDMELTTEKPSATKSNAGFKR